jgi:hypothetical protein
MTQGTTKEWLLELRPHDHVWVGQYLKENSRS